MERTGSFERIGMGLLTALAVFCALVVCLLAIQVARELRAMTIANTDNVQWSLAQAEVEFLELQTILQRAQHGADPDLGQVRQEFDIFYSRVGTLEDGPIYSNLRARPDFDVALTGIRRFLDNSVPLIDGPDTVLTAALPRLSEASEDVRGALRQLSVDGLAEFAIVMDERRRAIFLTMSRLAVVTVALVGALGLLAWYSHRVGRQAVHHGRELAEARDRALAGDKAKSDFLAVMSHEIRTPLNGILGNVALLEDSALDSDQSRYVRNMGISGRVLMDHVDAVLDLTRFSTGQITLTEEPVEIGQFLQDIVDGQDSRALSQGTRLDWHWVGPAMPWLAFDRAAFLQILLNFVSNALKFTPQGTVRIEAEHDASVQEIEFRVIDTGVGIAEAELPFVFDDFHTTDASFGRTAGGAGLGLGIARRLAEAMGGKIGAESTPGDGSVFWVRLAAKPASADRLHRPNSTPRSRDEAMSILVVEDNEINLAVTVDMLCRLGHMVDVARTGAEGVSKAGKTSYDLILMDIAMPEMDGLAATQTIRRHGGASADAPIVALSANVLPEDRTSFLAAGMSGVLTKPLRPAQLAAFLSDTAQDPDARSQTIDVEDIPDTLRDRFVEEISELLAWLEGGPQDRNEIADRCHRAAGTAAAFGKIELRKALNAVEAAATARATEFTLEAALAAVRRQWEVNALQM